MKALFRKQPRAFSMIFMLEIWERFGYYSVQGILTLFFIRYLGFGEDLAYHTFGAFSALVYGMVSIGGYLGDKVLGTKRTLLLGLCTLGFGYLSLAFVHPSEVFWALGLICVGNGLFKANPASLLSKCYKGDEKGLHTAFTLYYMAVNIGSIGALFISPWLSTRYGYPYAFLLSVVGILLGLMNYFFRRHLVKDIQTLADSHRLGVLMWVLVGLGIFLSVWVSAFFLKEVTLAKHLVWVIIGCVMVAYVYYMTREDLASRKRMLLALILMVEAVVFFTLYQQMPTSLNLFAVNHVRPQLLGMTIEPQSFQALNPIWIVFMSPWMAMIYNQLQRVGIELRTPYQFALGMICCGLSFGLLFFSRYAYDAEVMISSNWLIGSYLLQSLGELLVSALGLAMVAELVPKQISGFVMGMWFLTTSLAGFIGASVASYTSLPVDLTPGIQSLNIYTQVFGSIGAVTLSIGFILWWLAPRLCKLRGSGIMSSLE